MVRVRDAVIAGGVPITAMAIGVLEDRSTWRVTPASLQSAAQPIIDAFVLPTPQQLADEEADEQTQRKELRALAQALWECIPNPLMTRLQLKNRIIEIYKGLP